jgi:hypothetical protein
MEEWKTKFCVLEGSGRDSLAILIPTVVFARKMTRPVLRTIALTAPVLVRTT